MRDIKFRGKRIDTEDWVYGWYSRDFGYARILTEGDDYSVIPETVGQYIGLKDKNGKEIFEGDVLRNVDNPLVDKLPFKVVWNDYYGAWFWWSLEGEDGTDHFYQSIASDCEVIGNIHEQEG